jgi:hypothetical protein
MPQPDPTLAEIIAQLEAQLAAKDQQLARKDQALALAEVKIKRIRPGIPTVDVWGAEQRS